MNQNKYIKNVGCAIIDSIEKSANSVRKLEE